jgi:UDP-N-acetylglucosamine--N-acetylmuramyl-(pentapeptide) pyrophosphoryl-undecaprenol N-acetylglucosamine transferase
LWEERGGKVAWLGTLHGLDTKLVPPTGISYYQIAITGLRGKGVKGYLLAPWKIFFAIIQSIRIMKQVKPDVVLSMGGYVAGPGGIAAFLLRKPLVVHEQNSIPGTTNVILSMLAKKTLEAFPKSFGMAKHALWVGNPVRKDICDLPEPSNRLANRHGGRLNILVVGGSQGAQKINGIIPEMLSLFDEKDRPQVWHQTGEKHLASVESLYQQYKMNATIEPFIENMAEAFSWADLIICRSGALTISEIAAVGIGSILIPFLFAVDDHQTQNARFLAQAGAALILPELTLTAEKLFQQIHPLIEHREMIIRMAITARQLAKPDAVEKVTDICLEVTQ